VRKKNRPEEEATVAAYLEIILLEQRPKSIQLRAECGKRTDLRKKRLLPRILR
jgi:hypothetical protein